MPDTTLGRRAHGPEEIHRDADRIGAVARLAFARRNHPELSRLEAEALIDLVAAIMAMDAVDARIQTEQKTHSLNHQIAVEQAQRVYAQALAGLVRGERGD